MITTQTALDCPLNTQTVLGQNQVTVDCIRAHDYHTAVMSSSSALQSHRSIVSMQRELLLETSAQQDITYDQCILLTNVDDSNFKESEDCHSYVYDHGITFPAAATDLNLVTPILIFNAALAYQLLARQCNGEASLHCLHKAKRLYSLAYDAPDINKNPLFQFVIVNILAVIARQLGNENAWNTSMEQLLSLYMTLVDQGCTAILRQVQGFLVNALPPSPIAHVA